MKKLTLAHLEKVKGTNLFARNIVEMAFQEYRQKVLAGDPELVQNIYGGDILVVKGAYPRDQLLKIRHEIHQFGQQTKSSFHKILEGVPNFHRIVDENPIYNLLMRWHCYYFFNFNKDPWNLYKFFYEMYSLNQILSGYDVDEFLTKTPKDGAVARFQVVQYPQGGGYIQVHDHTPTINFKAITVSILSDYGEDYKSGGIYFLDAYGSKFYVDRRLKVGDVVVSYGRQVHGVDPVDPEVKLDWNSERGRWVCLFGNVKSDY